MAKYIRYPFAENGDRAIVQDTTQANGTISYESGYGAQYSLDIQSDPLARRINRDRYNQVLHDMTSNIQEWQIQLYPAYVPPSSNGNVSISYAKGVIVNFNGAYRISLVNNNTTQPDNTSNWADAFPIPVVLGGTGSDNAAGARTNLGVEQIAQEQANAGDSNQSNGGVWPLDLTAVAANGQTVNVDTSYLSDGSVNYAISPLPVTGSRVISNLNFLARTVEIGGVDCKLGGSLDYATVNVEGGLSPRTLSSRASDRRTIRDFNVVNNDITAALAYCFANSIELELPPVDLASPYIISSDLPLPQWSRVAGTVKARALSGNIEGFGAFDTYRQAYIKFTGSAKLIGGTGAGVTERAYMAWDDIVFLSASAQTPRPSTLNRVGTCIDGTGGGYCQRLFFHGFQRAWDNERAYLLGLKDTGIVACNEGYIFDDWNASFLDGFYADWYNLAFSSGLDAQASSIKDAAINVRPETLIGFKVTAQVKFVGFCYIEQFGAGSPGLTGLQLVVNSTSRGKPIDLRNIQFQLNDADYMMTIDCTDDGTTGIKIHAGVMANCRFFVANIAQIGFGIHPDFDGNATTALGVLKNIDTDSCTGLTNDDLVLDANSPYRSYAHRPYWTYGNNTDSTDISSSSFTTVAINEANAYTIESNKNNNVSSNSYRVAANGIFDINVNVSLQNSTVDTIPSCDALLRVVRNGTSTDITLSRAAVTIPPRISESISSKITLPLSYNGEFNIGDLIRVQGRFGDIVSGLDINIKMNGVGD